MLRYSPEQQTAVVANWRAFAAAQNVMQGMIGNQASDLIGNAMSLPRDVWQRWETEAVPIQRDILAVFNDLAASVQTPIAIGETINNFMVVSDSGEVNVSLDGRSNAKSDQPVYDYHGTPVPIYDTTFSFGWRQMEAASTKGFQLDAAARTNATRKIAERMETSALFGNPDIKVGNSQSYGILNHPKRGTRATGVTLNGATGAEWVIEITALLKVLHGMNFRVAPTIYLNWDDWFYASNTDYSPQYPNKSILQRIQEIGLASIVPASRVPVNNIVAVVKSREVIQILNAMPPSTIAKFRANPMDEYDFVRMAAAAVEVRWDYEDQCGIAHSA